MRARGAAALILAAAYLFNAFAQVTIEDEIVTQSVTFDVQADGQRSLIAAMGLSLALPGMGHYYIDRPKIAFAYVSADLAAICGAITLNSLANLRESGARAYAHTAAGIAKAPSGEAYWRHVGAFMDAAEYNENVELSRDDADRLYQDPEAFWRWPDESYQDEYNAARQKARNYRVASSFFVGALVANRILSVIDLRVFRKRALSSGIKFESAFMPSVDGGGMIVVRAEF